MSTSSNGPRTKSALLAQLEELGSMARDCSDCAETNRGRAEELVRYGRDEGLASVAELAEALGVSEGRVYQLTTDNYRPDSPKAKARRRRARASK